MKSLRTFFLGLALVALCAPLARAQGYYESDGGLYWSARGGLSQVRNLAKWNWGGYDPEYDTATPPNLLVRGLNNHREDRSLEMNYGFIVGASIGYTASYPESAADLRFELEGIYRKHEHGQINSQWTPISDNPDSDSLGFETVPIVGTLEVRSAMANLLIDFHTPTRVAPYIGVGAGISQMAAKGYTLDFNRAAVGAGFPQFFDEEINALSWQAIVGFGYHVSAGTMITVDFRHFELAGDRWSELFQTEELRNIKFDDWSIGLRLTF